MNWVMNFGTEFIKKAKEVYGTSEIPMNTFNKVWIVPDRADVYVDGTSVYIVNSRLKVLLEEDYLALDSNMNSTKHGLGGVEEDDLKKLSEISSKVIKEIILPEIEKEVNEGKTFANLRQIYNSMILAVWYKKNLKESLLGEIYFDQGKTKGVDIEDKEINQKIYDRYLQAFEKGVYDFIKDDYDSVTQEMVPRKYFSGGARIYPIDIARQIKEFTADERDSAMVGRKVRKVRGHLRAYADGSQFDGDMEDAASLSQIEAVEKLRSDLKKWFWGVGNVTAAEADKLIGQLSKAGVNKIGKQKKSLPLIYNVTHDRLNNVVVKIRQPDRGVLHKDIVDFIKAISENPHPNVQKAFQYGAVDERFIWFIQRWVRGETLKEYLDRNNNYMSAEDIRTIMQDLESGMAHIRNLGFLYLDLKKENIVVRRSASGRLGLTLIDLEAVRRYSEDGMMQVRFAGLLETLLASRDTRLIEYVIDSKRTFVSYAKSMKEKYKVSDEEGLVDVLARLFRKSYAIRGASGEVQYDSMFDVFVDIHNVLNLISDPSDTMRQEGTKDSAQLADNPTAAPGGIDFNSTNLNLNVQGSPIEMKTPINLQYLYNANVEGFLPVIINISPVISMPLLLGESQIEDQQQLSQL